MGLHKGQNNGSKGVKGRSGRKSAIEEKALGEYFSQVFKAGFEAKKFIEEFKNRMGNGGKINMAEFTVYRALKSDRILSELLRKVVPDQIKSEHVFADLADEKLQERLAEKLADLLK